MLLFLFILTLKNLNTMNYSCVNNPIFTCTLFHFCHNALMHDLNVSSMSEPLVISLVLAWKILRPFISYALRITLNEF